MSVLNNTDNNLDEFIGIVEKFLPFAQEQLEINEMPAIELISDSQNAADLLGKTAYYDPSAQKVVVYIDNRHAKDMLRSISHELVHHAQNQSGMFEGQLMMGDDYAQTNPHLREMEEDANLRGCMCVRDFVDQKIHLEETNSKRRVNSMKITEKELRDTIRNLIKENMEMEKEIPYNRDEAGVTRDADDSSPLSPEEIRAFLEASGRSGDDLHRYKWVPEVGHERAVETAPEEEEAPPADIAADLEADKPSEEPDEALEEEVVEVSDEVLNEARRRRRRRAARRAAKKTDAKAPAAPAAEAAPAAASEPAKKKAEPKKEVIAKKAPAKEKKAVKEWYGEELFGKLLKEAVK